MKICPTLLITREIQINTNMKHQHIGVTKPEDFQKIHHNNYWQDMEL